MHPLPCLIVLQEEKQGSEKSGNENQYDVACGKLANEAVLRLSADNVTVLVISIDKT